MNTKIVFDAPRVTRIAARFGGAPVLAHGDTWAQITLPFEDEVGRADVTWSPRSRAEWTVDPYLEDDPALTVAQTRALAASLLRAADLAEELNQPEPDMIVELLSIREDVTNTNLVLFDISCRGRGTYMFFSLRPDEQIGKHQPGDEWGRLGNKMNFIGKFDFIRWDERDGKKVALLKHR